MPAPQVAPPAPPPQGAPFRAGFDGDVLEGGAFRLTTPKEVDTLVKFLTLNRTMITSVHGAFDVENPEGAPEDDD